SPGLGAGWGQGQGQPGSVGRSGAGSSGLPTRFPGCSRLCRRHSPTPDSVSPCAASPPCPWELGTLPRCLCQDLSAARLHSHPVQVFYNGANVKQVDVPTLTGSFGILASHVPTLQVLRPGVVTVHAEDGTATKYFVSSGSVTVHADSTVQVLAEEAVTMDMLDLATAKSNLEKAVSEMAAASDEAAKAEAQIKVEANEALVKALE
uniref:ATP synthase F(1) complex subunit delta, mitochondrial n=1 Tax=Cyanistes caeruleus TaxID=156563 RepID=A0A8C0U3S5_CYACU